MNRALLKFADFELDPSRYELRRRGRPVKLEKIPMELLQLLAESDGRLVSREEIEERLWGQAVFVDAEHGINTAVRKLRQALGDDPGSPRFVQTVQRKGYRFVAEVRKVSGPLAAPSADEPTGAPDRPAERHSRFWLAAGAAAALLAWPAYRLVPPRSAHSVSASPVIRSIAVLPLENLSGNPEDEYFADGMTDELITTLAKYRSLRVISRTSIMQYRKVHRPLPEIARELSVDGIIEGSVSHSRDRVRVTAQLVYGPSDTHLWAESYDRDLRDVLSVQVDVARSIAEHVNLASAPPPGAPKTARVSAAARDAYLRGRFYWFSEGYQKSREFFEEAIRLDPGYAAAYAGLADSYTAAAVSGEARPLEVMPLAESNARKATDLDSSLAEVHQATAAILFFYRWDWDGAEKECRRTIEINPSFAEARHLHAYVLGTEERIEESLQEDRLTLELDPFARPWAYGYGLLRARRFDEALKEFSERSEARPDSAILHEFLWETYGARGEHAKAVEELKKTLVIEGRQATVASVEQAYRKGGYRRVNLEFLDRSQGAAAKEYVSPVTMATLASRGGRAAEALRYLELALRERDPRLVYLQHTPAFDTLHSERAYAEIVAKMNLPPLASGR